ncbi:MAG: four helix bundle protein [Bacteroidetes bacterium]|nr:four helix bundle protein [Bacteroidota bacterium]
MPLADRFVELEVYKLARTLSLEIYESSKLFPPQEVYSLTSQVRRSSRSIGAQIAEAWGKRQYAKHFVSKLTDANAELLETQHWIGTAVDCGYLEKDKGDQLHHDYDRFSRMLNSMILKADKFCKPFEK